MLDIKRVRENFDEVVKRIESRGHGDYGLKEIKLLDEKRRSALAEVEKKKNRQKVASKDIPKFKKEGKDTTQLMAEMKVLSDEIKLLDQKLDDIEIELRDCLLYTSPSPRYA